MILSDIEALDRIRQPYCGKELDELKKLCKEYRAQCTGKDAKQYLPNLPQFERDELRQERLKMMMSNVDVLSRTLKPRNRIFSARGGVEHFIISSQEQEKEFREYINNITQGLSLRNWIQQVVIKKNDYDPNGIILVEKNKKGKVYPCFISILDIHDRILEGRTPEYLIIKLNKRQIDFLKREGILHKNTKNTTEIFRVIDDTQDRLFNKEKLIIKTPSFAAPKLPAMVCSNLFSDEEGIFNSPLTDVFDLMKQYLLWSSLNNVVFARQAFPKEYMQKFDCPNCVGVGTIDGLTCPECHGSKIMLSQKHSDTLIVDWGDENNKNIPNPPMGNVQAAVDTLEFFAEALEHREDKIHYGVWGMYKSDKISSIHAGVTRDSVGSNIEPTAYQAMLNAQPMVTQLVEYSKWYIDIYKFVCDICGKTLLKDSYKGSSIMGGDRFMIESPDATWDRYLKAVKSQAPMSELDSILTEYIENKYCNNPILYRKYMLLMGVEPFLHYTIEQVEAFDIPRVQKQEKIYFSEWKTSLTDWEFTLIADGLNGEQESEELNEDDNDDVEEQIGGDSVNVNPVNNLRKAFRTWVVKKMKDDSGIEKPFVTESGIAIPNNSIVIKAEVVGGVNGGKK